jgi:hypothetical protein
MAVHILNNSKLWLHSYDLSGEVNSIALDYGSEIQDNTSYGASTRAKLGGLKTVTLGCEGFLNPDTIDSALFSNIGVADRPVSVAPENSTEGSDVFFFKSNSSEYSQGGAVGDVASFSVSAEATGDLVRGTIMVNGTKTASGTSTVRQLGAVSATQSVFASLHVLTVSGTSPTLDVIVKSDNASGFSSPANKITFTQATAIGSQFSSQAGAITDDYWRIDWTVGGSDTPTFAFVVNVGIL